MLPDKLVAGQGGRGDGRGADGERAARSRTSTSASTATGADGLPAKVSTGASGVAKTPITAHGPGRRDARAPAPRACRPTLPTLYVPTQGPVGAQRAADRRGRRPSRRARRSRRRCGRSRRCRPRSARRPSRPGAAITDTVKVTGLGGQHRDDPGRALRAVRRARPDHLRGRAGLDRDDRGHGRRRVRHGAGHARRARLLHLPRVDRRERHDRGRRDRVRGGRRDDDRPRRAGDHAPRSARRRPRPGAQITDTAVVTGLGKLAATVNVELWGPFPTRAAITCEGTPFWTGTFPAAGDGTYTTAPVTLTAAGYYTYRESIAATEAFDAVVTACGEAPETTIAKAAPKVTTVVSDAVVKPDAQLFDTPDRHRPRPDAGDGRASTLFGPYASRADIDCAGTPYWKGEVAGHRRRRVQLAEGDGPARRLLRLPRADRGHGDRRRRAGRVPASRPRPRSPRRRSSAAAATRSPTSPRAGGGPSRVKLARLGIDAPVSAIGIDLKSGALGIPEDIKRVGWWRDGADAGRRRRAPCCSPATSTAPRTGAGAFYALKSARRGDIVTLQAGGKTLRYRVTGMRRVAKAALPTSIYTRTGSPRARAGDLRRPVRRPRGPLPRQHHRHRGPGTSAVDPASVLSGARAVARPAVAMGSRYGEPARSCPTA